jgi:hypothetical protein
MSEQSLPSINDLPPVLAQRVDEVCTRFEKAWQDGQQPRLEEYLAGVPEAAYAVLLKELLLIEVAYRRRKGERPQLKEYQLRFPAHTALLQALAATKGVRSSVTNSEKAGTKETIKKDAAQDTHQDPYQTSPHVGPPADEPTGSDLPAIPGYQILGRLGKGGMGLVYRAWQEDLKRHVAVKFIKEEMAANPELLAQFRFEAEAVAQLNHPHIDQVYLTGTQRGLPYFVMELVEGGSLQQRVAEGPLPADQAARLVETVARAMHVAHTHTRPVIHRDLKPANILLAADGTPKVTDFGLAWPLEALKDQPTYGAIVGTPSYMAPEQARGRLKEVGPAADVYALGAILYECLTGRPPFKAATVMDTLLQVIEQEPVPPRQLNPQVPRDLETICLECLQKEPARRYASAEALAEDLRRFRSGEPVLARPVGVVERTVKWVKRRPTLAGLLTGSVILAAVAIVGIIYGYSKEAQRKIDIANIEIQHQTDIVNQALENTREQERLTKAAQEERSNAEKSLARGLLRVVGNSMGMNEWDVHPPTEIEMGAIWELAESQNDRVRLLFIEQALNQSSTLRQLRLRKEMALHAAVGLDRTRRQRVEEMLHARLQDKQTEFRSRIDCTLIGIALGGSGPAFAKEAAQTLIEAIRKENYSELWSFIALCEALEDVSAKLSHEDAGTMTRILVEILVTATADGNGRVDLRALLQILAASAARLDQESATAVACILSDAIKKKAASWQALSEPAGVKLSFLAAAWAIVLMKLGPEESTIQVKALASIPPEVFFYSHILIARRFDSLQRHQVYHQPAWQILAARYDRDDAEAAAHSLTKSIIDSATLPEKAYLGSLLVEALQQLTPRLDRQVTRVIASTFAEKITDKPYLQGTELLVEGWQAVLEKLEIAEATQQAKSISDALLGVVIQNPAAFGNNNISPSAIKSLVAVSKHLDRDAASVAAGKLFGIPQLFGIPLNQLLSIEGANPTVMQHCGQVWEIILSKIEPAEASKLAEPIAQALVDVITKERHGFTKAYLVINVWAVLSERVEPSEATRQAKILAQGLIEAISQLVLSTVNAGTFTDVVKAWAVVSVKLDPAEAANQARVMSRILIDAIVNRRYQPQVSLSVWPSTGLEDGLCKIGTRGSHSPSYLCCSRHC